MKNQKLTAIVLVILLVFSLTFVISEDTKSTDTAKPTETNTQKTDETDTTTNLNEKDQATETKESVSLWDYGKSLVAKAGASVKTETSEKTTNKKEEEKKEEKKGVTQDNNKKQSSSTLFGGLGNFVTNLLNGGDNKEQTQDQQTPNLKTPKQICTEDSYPNLENNITKILEDNNQFCSFIKANSNKKNEVWNKLTPQQKQEFAKKLGEEYGTVISGLEHANKWTENGIKIKDTTINLDFENYYSDDNKQRTFGFRDKKDWKYNRQPIRKIEINEDGKTKITFGDTPEKNGEGQSTLELSNGATFDPNTMKIKSGDKEYQWNGQGNVNFDTQKGELSLNFAKGKTDQDVTNFPIIKMPNGEEVSPFQVVVDKKLSGVKKPSSGYRITEDGKHTIDDKGVVREIKNTKIEIDKSGKIKSIENGFLAKNSLKGDLFALGKYGIGKDSKEKNFIDLTNGVLTIKSDSGAKLFYSQDTNLKKLEVTGDGETYIRNGDYVLQFKGKKIAYKKVPSAYQKNNGKFKNTIDEIVNPANPKNPLKITKDKNGNLAMLDSGNKPVQEGQIGQKPKQSDDNKGTGSKYIKKNSDGTLTIESQNYVKTDAVGGTGTGVKTKNKLQIKGIDNFPKGLSKQEFLDKIMSETDLEFRLDFVSSDVDKESIINTLKRDGAPNELISLVSSNLAEGSQNGKSLLFKMNKGKLDVSYTGKGSIAVSGSENAIKNYVKKQMSTVPNPKPFDKKILFGTVQVHIIPQAQHLDGTKITSSALDGLYNYYQSTHKE